MTYRRLAISILVLLPYALFGLSPTGISVIPEIKWNHARAVSGEILEFPKSGIVIVPTGAAWLESAARMGRFDIDLRVQPASGRAAGPARIFTSSLNPAERNLTIGQDFNDLVVRMRRPGTSPNGTPNIIVPNVFAAGRWVDIRVTFDGNELRILMDDKLAAHISVAPRGLSAWSTEYGIALGNELTWDRPWLGKIERAELSAGDLRLDLLSRENQDFPHFLLRAPSGDFARTADEIVNFLGFIPLGILLATWVRPLRLPVFLLLSLVVVSISAGIETFQQTLPKRTMSFRDFELNVLGGVTGLLMATLMAWLRRAYRPSIAREGAD